MERRILPGSPAAPTAPTAELIKVSPLIAQQWLATVRYHSYRPVSTAMVHKFAETMRRGEWLEDNNFHNPIRFDTSGSLRGGRMRLLAVIESGHTVSMWVNRPHPCALWQTQPGDYHRSNGGDHAVSAVRFDGHNSFTVQEWVYACPLDVDTVAYYEVNDVLRISFQDGRPLGEVCPGDWLVRQPLTYEVWDHDFFQREYTGSKR